MGETGKLCAVQGADGSVEAWLDGWHVHFPADEQEQPTFERGDPPRPVPGEVDGVTAGTFGDSVGVRYGRWIVVLNEHDGHVEHIAPRRRTDRHVYRLRSRR